MGILHLIFLAIIGAIVHVVKHLDETLELLGGVLCLLVAVFAVTACWWLWPLTGILVFIPAAIGLHRRLRRRPWEEQRPIILVILVMMSGGAIAFQIVKHGLPIAWWLAASGVSLVSVHIVVRRARDSTTLIYKILSSLRSSLIATTAGISLVVSTQLVLAYRTDIAPDQVRLWLTALADIRVWLQEVVLLSPVTLAFLLVALIAVTATISPSLHVARSYRRVANAASLSLLLVTVATSFTFFTAKHMGSWEGAWIAQRGDVLDQELADLDANRSDIVRLAAIEDALQSLPEAEKAELRTLAAEIDQYAAGEASATREAREARDLEAAVTRRTNELVAQFGQLEMSPKKIIPTIPNWHMGTLPGGKRSPASEPTQSGLRWNEAVAAKAVAQDTKLSTDAAMVPDREMVWKQVTDDLVKGAPVGPIAARADSVISVLERAPVDPIEANDIQAIERLRDSRRAARAGASVSNLRLDDLDVLRIQRTRANAARQEVYDSVKELVLSTLIPRSGLTHAFISGLLTRIKVKPGAFRGFIDRYRARQAMPPPTVWHSELDHALGAPARAQSLAPALLLGGVVRRVVTTRKEAAMQRATEVETRAQNNASAIRKQQEWLRSRLNGGPGPQGEDHEFDPTRPRQPTRPREPARPYKPASSRGR